jgi:uncharacterized protein YbcI
MRSPEDTRLERGQLASAISNALLEVARSYTGRGHPTHARTTIDDNLIVCVLDAPLTEGEKTLVGGGETRAVIDMRRAIQSAMSDEVVGIIEELTQRAVAAFMSSNHLDPDLAVETFVLEPLGTSAGDGPDGSERPRSPKHRQAGDHTGPRGGRDGRTASWSQSRVGMRPEEGP